MANDPNSFKADQSSCRYVINKYQSELKKQQDLVWELQHQNKNLNEEYLKIVNSRGWKALEIIRKLIPYNRHPKNLVNEESSNLILSYKSTYEDNVDFSSLPFSPEVKTIAFYHTKTPRWSKIKAATPRFANHYQPHLPHKDIGYYALNCTKTIQKQIDLAKQHGIYGFCFQYDWPIKKLPQKSIVDIILENPDLNFPFCFCFTNANQEKNNLKNSIKNLKKYTSDPRYIKINNRPVILILSKKSAPKLESDIRNWRKTAKENGIGDLYIWTQNTIFDHDYKNAEYADNEFDFAPNTCSLDNFITKSNKDYKIFNYSNMVKDLEEQKTYYEHYPIKPFRYSCCLGWDNSPMEKIGYTILDDFSIETFYYWLRIIIEETIRRFPKNERFILVNAWNNWEEGMYLEPDQKYGYANINTLSKAIYGIPLNTTDDDIIIDKDAKITKNPGRIAVQAHVYFLDILDELLDNIQQIPYKFDLYISTDTEEKKSAITKQILARKIKYNKLKIEVVENIGRDIFPFLHQMSKVYQQYDIIGHFHTKKTTKQLFGDRWRKHLYHNLLDSQDYIKRLFALFDDPKTGIIIPRHFYVIRLAVNLGPNKNKVNLLLERIGLPCLGNNTKINFPSGTMFWAKSKCIKDILDLNLTEKDFPIENGQLDDTIAHAIERLFGIVPEQRGYKVIEVTNKLQ